MQKKNLLLACFFLPVLLMAESMRLEISFLGITVVHVNIRANDSLITVKARSTALASLAAEMNNNYISNYEADFLTISYSKKVLQKDYSEDRITFYDRKKMIAKRKSEISAERTKDYPIHKESRDFFSALFYLRSKVPKKEDTLWLDANSIIWKATFRKIKNEKLTTIFGKMETVKYEISFENFSDKEKERSDMLTNNLVSESKKLFFWFTADAEKIPVKAVFAMKPFPVVWKLTSYSNE